MKKYSNLVKLIILAIMTNYLCCKESTQSQMQPQNNIEEHKMTCSWEVIGDLYKTGAIDLFGITESAHGEILAVGTQGNILSYQKDMWEKVIIDGIDIFVDVITTKRGKTIALGNRLTTKTGQTYALYEFRDNSWKNIGGPFNGYATAITPGNKEGIIVVGENSGKGFVSVYTDDRWSRIDSTMENYVDVVDTAKDGLYVLSNTRNNSSIISCFRNSKWLQYAIEPQSLIGKIRYINGVLFAVGKNEAGGSLILRKEDNVFSRQDAVFPMGIKDIALDGNGILFALGQNGEVFRNSNDSWTQVTPGSNARINTLELTTHGLTAVGYKGDVLRYNCGDERQKIQYNTLCEWEICNKTPGEFYDIWTGDDLYIVGGNNIWRKNDNDVDLRLIWRKNRVSFQSVCGDKGNVVFAVGSQDGNRGIVVECNDGHCEEIVSEIDGDIGDVWGRKEGPVILVSQNSKTSPPKSTLWRYDGNMWEVLSVSTKMKYEKVLVVEKEGKRKIFVFGSVYEKENELIVRCFEEKKYKDTRIDEKFKISSVLDIESGEMYLVGYNTRVEALRDNLDSGIVMYYNGTRWTKIFGNRTVELFSIWGKNRQQIFVGGLKWDKKRRGNIGTVLQYDGEKWVEDKICSDGPVEGMALGRNNEFYAIQREGKLLKRKVEK